MPTGALVAGTKLFWPQTEYLKALVARAEWQNDAAARGGDLGHLALIAQHYCGPTAQAGTTSSPATASR